MSLNNKTILITGGVGSFGTKFIEIVLKKHNPKSIRIYDNNELAEVEAERKFNNDPRLRFFIGDVRDKDRLYRAMNDVDIVVHAAALKHVPICEYNPIEAVKTNINGTINVIDAAIENGAEKVIGISTDKAVHPVNLYGATKMVAEKLLIQGNNYVGDKNITKFSCTRYGNVVGSSGSVIPLFNRQKQNGEITITDKKMTRFWVTLEQGVNFVIDCIEKMKGGEIFVPKIPSMRIMDLAEAIAPNAKIKIIGIRPGEKINEVLITAEETSHSVEYNKYFVINPESSFFKKNCYKKGKPLPTGFSYVSNINDRWLSKKDLEKIIEDYEE